ncbi:hypothetical protein SKAU_G00400920 [Synaphobranchus kaupii]|uniref:Uncharacterized protein n=1 Tax=Synaphobranchus kaupii TaxID=118154 RepID=A0A9Q1IAC9_SYNKA|nr:hypothetical protein SKAU_G00400920 [Synaphobranchus kaupii]
MSGELRLKLAAARFFQENEPGQRGAEEGGSEGGGRDMKSIAELQHPRTNSSRRLDFPAQAGPPTSRLLEVAVTHSGAGAGIGQHRLLLCSPAFALRELSTEQRGRVKREEMAGTGIGVRVRNLPLWGMGMLQLPQRPRDWWRVSFRRAQVLISAQAQTLLLATEAWLSPRFLFADPFRQQREDGNITK